MRDLLAQADISYANLEGTVAAGLDRKGEAVGDPGRVFDRRVYSSYPRFNYHPSLLPDLIASGIDVVSTANNHAMDREPPGVDATIAALEQAGLPHTGTRARGQTGPWHALTRARGITVAWLACTESTNQIPDPDGQVLRCHEPKGALEQQVRALAPVGKRGVDVVFEHTGMATWEASLRLARRGGTIVTCGASSGHAAVTDLRQVFFRQLQLLGSTMGSKAHLHRIVELVAPAEVLGRAQHGIRVLFHLHLVQGVAGSAKYGNGDDEQQEQQEHRPHPAREVEVPGGDAEQHQHRPALAADESVSAARRWRRAAPIRASRDGGSRAAICRTT